MSTSFFVNQTNPEIFYAIPRPGGIANITIPERPKRIRKEGSSSGSKLDVGSRSQTGSRVNTASRTRTTSSRTRTTSSRTKTLKIKTSATRSRTSGSKIAAGGTSKTTTASSSRKSLLTVSTSYGDETIDLDIDTCPRQYKVKQIIAATPWSVEFDEYLEPTEDSKRIPDPFQDAVDMLAMTISVIMLLSRDYNTIGDSHFKWVLSYLKCIKDEFGQTPPNVQGILNHINQVTGGKIKSFLEEDEEDEPVELGQGQKGVRISPNPPDVAPSDPELPPEQEADAS